MKQDFELFASCLPGLEPLLLEELKRLGVREPRPLAGGVAFAGEMAEVYRVNLWSGLASHVLLRIARFHVRHLPQLKTQTGRVEWGKYLRPGVPVAVNASCKRSKIYHSGAVEGRVTAAVAASLGATSDDDTQSPGANLRVRMFEDECSISLDTSGEPLHRRGWRLSTAKAPLREDLAHALILASGWDLCSPLLDPFMGSGTIPVEAAALAQGMPPGRGRRFGFEQCALFDEGAWKKEQQAAEARRKENANVAVFGSDRDAGAVASAEANAARAGVSEGLTLVHAAISDAPILGDPASAGPRGAVVTNPPFGKRVGANKDLLPLYQTLGQRLVALPLGWRCAILAAERRLALRTGLPLKSAFLTSHGGLKVNAMVGGS